jgi:hypothetical protein
MGLVQGKTRKPIGRDGARQKYLLQQRIWPILHRCLLGSAGWTQSDQESHERAGCASPNASPAWAWRSRHDDKAAEREAGGNRIKVHKGCRQGRGQLTFAAIQLARR